MRVDDWPIRTTMRCGFCNEIIIARAAGNLTVVRASIDAHMRQCETSPDDELISMAEIGRMTGRSRAAVGNWKARNADFPPERARVPRGPLYDRAEVLAWLESRLHGA